MSQDTALKLIKKKGEINNGGVMKADDRYGFEPWSAERNRAVRKLAKRNGKLAERNGKLAKRNGKLAKNGIRGLQKLNRKTSGNEI